MSQNFADGLLEAERFQVVLAGQAAAANDSAAARELADKLDASPDQIAAMLKMPNYVAAHDLTRENAERYAEIFAAVGVEVRVEPETVRLAINFPPSSSPVPKDVEHNEIRRLADYQRVSGVLWIVLGIVQILSVYGIIAGVWNIPAGINAASGRKPPVSFRSDRGGKQNEIAFSNNIDLPAFLALQRLDKRAAATKPGETQR